jgi:hypothetical protein
MAYASSSYITGGSKKKSKKESKNIKYNEDIKKYNTLNDVRLKDITEALEIVNKYIKEKGLILVGGQALDYAFKLKNHNLYEDWELPDYDFYSPQHHTDAYNLGKLLCDKGFSDISVINARHITTMKVRIQFVVVADITYCPKKIFDTLDTLDYKGMKIINPHYQRLDLFLSLARPFQNPPMEVIQHRHEKDLKRMIKLDEIYPVSEVVDKIDIRVKNNIKHSKQSATESNIQKYSKKYVYTGLYAYHIYREAFVKEYKQRFAFELPDIKPDKMSMIMRSKNIQTLVESIKPKKMQKYRPYLDKRAAYFVFDGSDKDEPVFEVYQDEENITHVEYDGLKAVNIFHLMFYFMFQFLVHKDNESLIIFDALLCMAQYASVHRSKISPMYTISVDISSYADDALDILNREKMDKVIAGQQPARFQPRNYYPEKDSGCKSLKPEQQSFDITDNKYFLIDGEPVEYNQNKEGGYDSNMDDNPFDALGMPGVIGCINSGGGEDVDEEYLLSRENFSCIEI